MGDGDRRRVKAVKAALASDMLSDEELDNLLNHVCGGGREGRSKETRLQTGVWAWDHVLLGGLDDGMVVSVHAEAGAGGSQLCRALLVSSLLEHKDSIAIVVDTTGNFDVLRLYTLIHTRLKTHNPTESEGPASIDNLAAETLGRVKIIRAFDFEGVEEAIYEIRCGLEKTNTAGKQAVQTQIENTTEEVVPADSIPAMRSVIPDSEDEEDDDDMLYDTEAVVAKPAFTVYMQDAKQGADHPPSTECVKFLLIDNLVQVINPLLKRDFVQAHALASAFLQSLAQLTRSHALHSVLLNPSTTLRAPSPAPSTAQSSGSMNQQQYRQQPPAPLPPSIFAGSTAMPILMGILQPYFDAGLLLTKIPKKQVDAKLFYDDAGKGTERGAAKIRGVKMMNVLEIVSDRWGGRVGRWCTVAEDDKSII